MKNLTPAKVSLLMFGIVGFLIIAFVAKRMMAVDEPPPEVTTRNIPMLVSEIAEGTVISASHLGLGPINIQNLTPDILLSNRAIVGRVAKVKISAATPLRADMLYQIGQLPQPDIGKDMRAVSVSLAETVAIVDGLIKPGDFVDVHLTASDSARDDRLQGGLTMILFRGVRIVAINRNYAQGPVENSGNNVTLELTQEQANIMILAQKYGGVTLTYSPDGKGNGGLALDSKDRVTLEQILGLKPIPKPGPPYFAEIFRGPSREEVYFESNKKNSRRVNGGRNLRNDNNYGPADAAPTNSAAPGSSPVPDSSGANSNPPAASTSQPQQPSA
ncbi:MAG: Flp pilus assembly protein CpaB [Planctomycetaceae bacterium]